MGAVDRDDPLFAAALTTTSTTCTGRLHATLKMFSWAHWTKLIGDAITTVRTGEPLLYPDDEDDGRRF